MVHTRRRLGFRLAAIAAGLVTALLAAEVGARVFAMLSASSRREAWEAAGSAPAAARQAALLGQIVRPVANRRRIYELVPNVDVTFIGVSVKTDSHGFRSPEYPELPADDRTIRIVGLGDSVMFAWGAEEPDGFIRQLEGRLSALRPSFRWEAINTGVPGYNTVMEVEMLRDRGLAFAPDLVILDLVSNDLDLPNFLPYEPDYWTLQTSFLLEYLVSAIRGWETQALRPLIGSPRADSGRPAGAGELERVPERYRDLVGLEPFRRALADLRELSERHGFEVVVSTLGRVDPSLRPLIEAQGFAIAETGDRVDAFLRERGIDRFLGSPLTNSAIDPHPSRLGHGLEAQAILDCLIGTGILDRITDRK